MGDRSAEEVRQAQSFNNKYRKALANISRLGGVILCLGKVERLLKPTDVMTILRDCRIRLGPKGQPHRLTREDYGFLAGMIRKMGTRPKSIRIGLPTLMRLRRIAYPGGKS